MPVNTLTFLQAIVKRFDAATLPVRVFGGWAEELWQITPGRIHNDIDFLYSGATFEHLDHFLAQNMDIQEIQEKRFSHKRAISFQDVMIEFLLVQHDKQIYFTDFFSERYHFEWPADVFCHTVNISGYDIQIASKQALLLYRQCHKQVERAYREFL